MKKKLEVRSEVRDETIWVYTLAGGLFGSQEGYSFQNEVRSKVAEGAKGIVIDLEQVDRIDSSGIGILVAIMWSASQGNSCLVLAALSPEAEKILGLAMLLDHIDHAESVELAIEKIRMM